MARVSGVQWWSVSHDEWLPRHVVVVVPGPKFIVKPIPGDANLYRNLFSLSSFVSMTIHSVFFLCLLWGYIFLVSLWPFLLCHLWRLFLFSLAFKILDLQGLPLGCLLSSLCKHLYLSLPQSQIPSPPAQTTTVTSHIHSSCLLILQPLESSLYIQPEWFSKWQSDNPSAMQTPHWIPSSLRKKRQNLYYGLENSVWFCCCQSS